jgi:hypothetical protein
MTPPFSEHQFQDGNLKGSLLDAGAHFSFVSHPHFST